VPLTREDVRAAVERAGDAHWQALIRHHEDPYPRPAPTPGDVCRAEAERLTALGLADQPGVTLKEARVTRRGEEVELVHLFAGPTGPVPDPTATADQRDRPGLAGGRRRYYVAIWLRNICVFDTIADPSPGVLDACAAGDFGGGIVDSSRSPPRHLAAHPGA
jgi:hypothetical protein